METYHYGLRHRHALKICSLFYLFIANAVFFQGCGTLSNGRGWGQDATLTPGWERIRSAAVNAAVSPETWAPVAAALALQIDDVDERISDWASDNRPVFGSMENAREWSNRLEVGSCAVYFVTAMAAPSGDDASDWFNAKSKGIAVGLAAVGITGGGTKALKKISGRTRPDASDNKSFPSGHASDSAAYASLARRNLDSISLPPKSRMFADIGIAGIAAGTGWARVEAKVHYPSDVLAGYALGHYFSAFINDAFLGLDSAKAPKIAIAPSGKGLMVGLSWAF